MRTVSWVGLPSSSKFIDPRRLGIRAVVDDGDFFAGDLFADEPCECRRLFAVEVGLQAVADRLVEQDAGPSGTEDDGHLAGRGRDGVEL